MIFHPKKSQLNYLAHLFLSGSNTDLMIGNYIGDSLKGVDIAKFNSSIQNGVKLHRYIDQYTDNHPVVAESKLLIRHEFSKFTPVVIDVYYDYFLANTWHNHSKVSLDSFALKKYALLQDNHDVLPYGAQRFLHYMQSNNILVAYKTMKGIAKVFWGMSHRTKFKSRMELAHEILPAFEDQISVQFNSFFEDLKNEVRAKFNVDI